MRLLVWIVRGLVFFALFAFALNNRHDVIVHWFFGYQWRAPLVVVVLAAFALGCALGVLAMTPAWWRRRTVADRRMVSQSASATPASTIAPAKRTASPSDETELHLSHPPGPTSA